LQKLFSNYFKTSELQFGFKLGVGCRDAIFTARSVIQYYNERGSTITACALDMAKAFDRVDFYCLFLKLMKRNMPRQFIHLIAFWYTNCVVSVKWDNYISKTVTVGAGVRQGGVLSPTLFAIYIDDLILTLRDTGWGCYIGKIFLGCIVYAYDILLLSVSLTHLQLMFKTCDMVAGELDIKFNSTKSFALRIGSRYKRSCSQLVLGDRHIHYVNNIKYLGVVIKSAKKFSCSFDHVKLKFYRAFNSLYAKSKAAQSELVSVQLTKSFCLPLITYALEVSDPSPSSLRILDGLLACATRKIFSVTDVGNVQDIRHAVGFHGIESVFIMSITKYLLSFYTRSFSFAPVLFDLAFKRLKPTLINHNICDITSKVKQLKILAALTDSMM
jgi:hypothetical protein